MPDASYDVVIIGAGAKALTLAMYLTRYGKMQVALFEKRHEVGGGWASDELLAPGFITNPHAYIVTERGHFDALYRDFDFKEKGAVPARLPGCAAAIFREDHSCLVSYSADVDPTGERTAREYARFSARDGETYMKLAEKATKYWFPALVAWLNSPPLPPGTPDALEKLTANPESGMDPRWVEMSPAEVYRDMFQSPECRKMPQRLMQMGGLSPVQRGLGVLAACRSVHNQWLGTIVGGTHNLAHAAHRIIIENGGKFFTLAEVDRIIIQNGKATGIRLTDGTEIGARKAVVSTLSPSQLCSQLIGKEYVSSEIRDRIEKLARNQVTITWYSYAVHQLPIYTAAAFNPDVNNTFLVWLTNKDENSLVKYEEGRERGMLPPIEGETSLQVSPVTLVDPTQAPKGKHIVMTETFTIPATAMGDKEWLEYHKTHAREEIEWWHEYAPNMTWDNVITYNPETPYTTARRLTNMAPSGNWAVIDNIPSQIGRSRPIPELARYKVPEISGLYCTGAAWHPIGRASSDSGYNCYKIMADDFGLRKPWEEKGYPW